MNQPQRLTLRQIPQDSLIQLFQIYSGNPERRWLAKAWRILGRSGLTTYRNASEFNSVLGRLAVLALIYHRWVESAYQSDSGVEDQVREWRDCLPFIRAIYLSGLPQSWNETPSGVSESVIHTQRMMDLIKREHVAVFDALIANYGDGWEFVLARDLRAASGRPHRYQLEYIAEMTVGPEFWKEYGVTPREMDTISALNQRFYI